MLASIVFGLSSLLTTPIISNSILNVSTIVNNKTIEANQFKIEQLNYDNNKEKTIDKSIEYRLYIDSTNDTLKPEDNKIDYNLGYQAKDQWYDLNLLIGIYNFKDFEVNNKTDLISKIGSKLRLDYSYAFNMWDSKYGWKYSDGKDVSLTKTNSVIELRTEDHIDEIQYQESGTNTEAAKIKIKQEWAENKLQIFLTMSVWYHWAWGSIYNHATLNKFSLNDINNDGSSKMKFASKNETENQYLYLSPGEHLISLDKLFNNAKEIYMERKKENWIMVAPLFVSFAIAGPMTCSNGWGYGRITLMSFEPLVNDLAKIMMSGSNSTGNLKVINTNLGGTTTSSLYYQSITNISHHIGQTNITNQIGCSGISNLSYIYLTE